MGHLVYASLGSLDGYIADTNGDFDWCAPDAEVHSFLNARDRSVSAELYGRRMYEVMKVWETYGTGPEAHPAEREYAALWRRHEKIVYSTSLLEVDTANTRLERNFDPVAARAFVDAQPGDVNISGADLGGQALHAGIVDRIEYYAVPWIVGGGIPWLPDDLRVRLHLISTHSFASGVVHSVYSVAR